MTPRSHDRWCRTPSGRCVPRKVLIGLVRAFGLPHEDTARDLLIWEGPRHRYRIQTRPAPFYRTADSDIYRAAPHKKIDPWPFSS